MKELKITIDGNEYYVNLRKEACIPSSGLAVGVIEPAMIEPATQYTVSTFCLSLYEVENDIKNSFVYLFTEQKRVTVEFNGIVYQPGSSKYDFERLHSELETVLLLERL